MLNFVPESFFHMKIQKESFASLHANRSGLQFT